ncbi:App1 family protein [Candidatus Moduliflexota bacterium]
MRRIWKLTAICMINLACLSAGFPAHADLKSDESCLFYPSQAYRTDAGRWEVPLRGWVYEPEEHALIRTGLLAAFRRLFGRDWTGDESELFTSRARWFLADSEGGKSVTVRVGDARHPVGPSDSDGRLKATFPLSEFALTSADGGGWVSLAVEREPGILSPRSSWVQPVPPAGLSVISDIDDTIKVTGVSDRRELLRNTFLRPFMAVQGMAGLYADWAGQGAVFHYVSGSPWQLYPVLSEFFEKEGFPRGGYYLRDFSLGPSGLADILSAPKDDKARWIGILMDRYPGRRFILVGDSGEADPEIYGEVARSHPGQVTLILIRNVTGEGREDKRYADAFLHLPPELWQLFSTGDQLQTALPSIR